MFIWDNNTLFVLFLQLTMARTKLRLSSYIRKRKGIGVRNIPAKKIKNNSLSNKIYLPPSTTKKTHKCQISSIKTQLFGEETDDLVCDCNHDTDQYSDARSKLERTKVNFILK